tara:strand:- start:85 stop:777 length:693 start_codon:yes stop_codon:yes gene_type:complete
MYPLSILCLHEMANDNLPMPSFDIEHIFYDVMDRKRYVNRELLKIDKKYKNLNRQFIRKFFNFSRSEQMEETIGRINTFLFDEWNPESLNEFIWYEYYNILYQFIVHNDSGDEATDYLLVSNSYKYFTKLVDKPDHIPKCDNTEYIELLFNILREKYRDYIENRTSVSEFATDRYYKNVNIRKQQSKLDIYKKELNDQLRFLNRIIGWYLKPPSTGVSDSSPSRTPYLSD